MYDTAALHISDKPARRKAPARVALLAQVLPMLDAVLTDEVRATTSPRERMRRGSALTWPFEAGWSRIPCESLARHFFRCLAH